MQRVSPSLPDVTRLSGPPDNTRVRRWLIEWRPVWFRAYGCWNVGVVRAKVQMADGTWVMHVEHRRRGVHETWPDSTWMRYDPRLVLPVGDPPLPGPVVASASTDC